MGPRFRKRGNAASDAKKRSTEADLQWGRAFGSAETLSLRGVLGKACRSFNGAALSEARKRLIHPVARGRGHRLQWGRAFGSAETTSLKLDAITSGFLQWGRAFGSAETKAIGGLNPKYDPLQWGRAFGSAETNTVDPRPPGYSDLQWGRAFGSAETL